jgi:hypothetical protein
MTIHSLAGKPPPKDLLIDIGNLLREYYERKLDFTDRAQRVDFGTSGHRGSSPRGSFNEAHVLAITQAICDYRSSQGITGLSGGGKIQVAASGQSAAEPHSMTHQHRRFCVRQNLVCYTAEHDCG